MCVINHDLFHLPLCLCIFRCLIVVRFVLNGYQQTARRRNISHKCSITFR